MLRRFFESFWHRARTLAYAHTMVDYVNLAKTYGRLGGLDRTATLIKAIRADRGEKNVLLLDGGDTWQGSFSSLKTNGQDMVDAMAKLQPDAMVGHWEFTFGVDRVQEIIESINYPFLGGNVFDTEWDEPVFESTAFFERGGIKVAVIGQHFPYLNSQSTVYGSQLVVWYDETIQKMLKKPKRWS